MGGALAVRNMKESILAEKDRGKKPNVIQSFFRETAGELRKVSWPTWPEAASINPVSSGGYVCYGHYPRYH